MTSPRADSPAGFCSREMSAVMDPMTRLARGAERASYRSMRAVTVGAGVTPAWAFGRFSMGFHRQVPGGPAQDNVDDGEQPPPGVGHGDPLAVDLTHELIVRVARDDHVHRVVQASGDLGDGPRQARAAVALAAVRPPTLMEQDHDSLDPLLPQTGNESVDRLCFVDEGQPLNLRLGHYSRCAF